MTADIVVLPEDSHNKGLLANAHPSGWQNPDPAPMYNVVVIGAGTAGLVTAAGAAGLGARVALVEKHLMGGDCLNVGCVPSKCIIRSSRVAAELRDAAAYGLKPDGAKTDFSSVMERMRSIRVGISEHDSVERFAALGIDIFLGNGSFAGPDSVEVEGSVLKFKKAVIASGARAAIPPITGLAEVGYLTNETVFSLTERPEHLIVLGTGPIGCELAQAFRRLGSVVTMIGRSKFMSKEDTEAAAVVEEQFKSEGIEIVYGETTSVSVSGGKKILTVRVGENEQHIEGSEILVAVGRAPRVSEMCLEKAGVAYDERLGVHVDDRLRTTNPAVFAAGDVCMTHKFTHAADAAARIVIQNALFKGRKKLSSLVIPRCTYTAPEVAHVGLSEADAERQGTPVDVFRVPMDEVDRALADGEDTGFAKVLVEKGADKIVGATIVASHAGDMISEVTLAISAKVGLGRLASVIHPYPTQAEVIKKVADAYNRTRLSPGLKKLFERWMTWLRR